jgi:hypothetical protein
MISYPKSNHKKLIFQGNSLFDTNVNHTINGLKYVTLGIYDVIRAIEAINFFDYSISGQDQTQINALIATKITPMVTPGDIVVIWEGTNDLAHDNGLSGAGAYANLVTFCNAVQALGGKLIVCTAIARDNAIDAADLMDRIDDYNILIRANQSTICDALCDLGGNAVFDTRADASNLTYYTADKLHLAQGGQDLVISLVSTSIQTLL